MPAPCDGVIRRIDASALGLASVLLGAGRMVASDTIDFAVGFSGIRKTGEIVAKGEPLLTIHARDMAGLDMAKQAVEKAIVIE
jgi:thymidine phosphorylase